MAMQKNGFCQIDQTAAYQIDKYKVVKQVFCLSDRVICIYTTEFEMITWVVREKTADAKILQRFTF